jgi:Holliday junction DNA helicase RuvA
MINYLKGTIKYKNRGHIVLDVHDVGYQVYVLPQLLEKAKTDSETELYTYQHVTENKVELFGFNKISELEFFEQLIQISGIGPKSALGIMNQASVEDIKRAIIHGDSSMLTRVSGIGKKTAERIILELKNKIDISDKDNKEFLLESGFQEDADAIDGLVSLGYSLREAREAIKHIPREAKTVEEKVKASLKILGRK